MPPVLQDLRGHGPVDDGEDGPADTPLPGPVHRDQVPVPDPRIPQAVPLHPPPKGRGGVAHDPGDRIDLLLEIIPGRGREPSTHARLREPLRRPEDTQRFWYQMNRHRSSLFMLCFNSGSYHSWARNQGDQTYKRNKGAHAGSAGQSSTPFIYRSSNVPPPFFTVDRNL